METTTKWYEVAGYDNIFICKIEKLINPYSDIASYTLTFGGPDKFCATISMRSDTPHMAYIDYVEYDEKCAKAHILEVHQGTYKLMSTFLHFTSHLFPEIRRFTLIDDSHIYCVKGSKEYKMDLAADYIFKYDATWYEKKFGARLPKDIYDDYKLSLYNLDGPLKEISDDSPTYIREYKDIYMASSSPREFIANMRQKYGESYCMKIAPWLHNYLFSIGIVAPRRSNTQWFIDVGGIVLIPNFSSKEIARPQVMKGGKKKGTRRHRNLVTYNKSGCISNACEL